MVNDTAVQVGPVTQERALRSYKRVWTQRMPPGNPLARKSVIHGPQAAKQIDCTGDILSRWVSALHDHLHIVGGK